eukprot:2431317-Amphidinium_carterae.1
MYYELAGSNCKALKKVATPYIPDNELCPDGVGAPQAERLPNSSTPDEEVLSAAQPGGNKPHEKKKMNKYNKNTQ